MLLYHFTYADALESIQREGLTRGEVPLSATKVLHAVWLTTDRESAGHGLSDGGIVGAEERAAIEWINGTPLSDEPVYRVDKRAVRITVKLPSTDRNLVYWPKWGRKYIDRHWYEILDKTGGGKSRTWYLYWGVIPPDKFMAIDRLR